ncbi:tRNA (adenosine(37)-N6)-threonylcarbamoyltransferase complex dimerization subunit type 1 TsaB [Nitratidesulfovibrio termitidis]|uniref:tRNA (adenosine(37)-N6)-threonylcarbamoyltransferase complex dimerization subunit type 1 TsaB n=1 Tax=Nitratidesulfovibrio termitidis TaxID=42252 RepID=UPI0004220461|nr:tRNA (adenosine(37)-N6)-threonylcarbamoyltransferase complex dimerization subunit type 1 TsaB [Nitratidesulfovibrio termitidis]
MTHSTGAAGGTAGGAAGATGACETDGDGAITLALNAAESRVQAAALRDGEALFAQEWHVPSQGTELLAPALADAFARMRLSLHDVRRIACVQGPGSFTGLRLVLSTAAGMARALDAELAGLSYTQLLACGPLLPRGTVLWVLTHARRGLVHMQAFRMPGETLDAVGADAPDAPDATVAATPAPLPEALTPVEAATLDAAVARIVAFQSGLEHAEDKSAATGCDTDAAVARIVAFQSDLEHAEDKSAATGCDTDAAPSVWLMGSGATRNRAVLTQALAELLPQARFLPSRFDHPAPALLLPLASAAAYGPDDVQPLYVRPCDAEENLPAMAAARGMDPEQARLELARLTSAPLADISLADTPPVNTPLTGA